MEVDFKLFGIWVAGWLGVKVFEFFSRVNSRNMDPHLVEVLARISASQESIVRMLDRMSDKLEDISKR